MNRIYPRYFFLGLLLCLAVSCSREDSNVGEEIGDIVATLPLRFADDVAVAGDYAFVTMDSLGVAVVDIHDPRSPVVLDTLQTHHESRELFVHGHRLYVADFRGGITVFDISDPGSPTELANYPSAGDHTNDIFVTDNHIFEAGGQGSNGLLTIRDLSGSILGTYTNTEGDEIYRGFACVWVDGDRAYAGTNGGWLHIIDVSNPSVPVKLGEYYNPGITGYDVWVLDVLVSGTRAYLADWGGGFIVLDVSDPANPQELGVFKDAPDGPDFYDVALDGSVAYTANGWGCLAVIDVSDPTNMSLILSVNPRGSSYHGIALYGSYAIIADNGAKQMAVIRVK
ncbi:MAG: hypothetical protein ABIM74_04675 [candidate division WOR-3 bacterium]